MEWASLRSSSRERSSADCVSAEPPLSACAARDRAECSPTPGLKVDNMERTLIAYSLMALLVVAGVVIGLYLRRSSRELTLRRQRAREKFQRQATTLANGRQQRT